MIPKLEIDTDAKAMYLSFSDEKIDHTTEVRSIVMCNVDFDIEGNPVGIELILGAAMPQELVPEQEPEVVKNKWWRLWRTRL